MVKNQLKNKLMKLLNLFMQRLEEILTPLELSLFLGSKTFKKLKDHAQDGRGFILFRMKNGSLGLRLKKD